MNAALFVALLMIPASQAAAQDVEAGSLLLIGAWARAADPERRLSYAFLTVRNRGSELDRLLGASSPAAAAVELREPDASAAHGARVASQGLAIPANGALVLEPGGAHLLLRDLQQPLTLGDAIRVDLRFERAGILTLQLRAHFH